MECDKPSIYHFATDGGLEYVFDNVSGLVTPCDQTMHRVIQMFKQATIEEIVAGLARDNQADGAAVRARHAQVSRLVDAGCFFRSPSELEVSGFRASEHLPTSFGSALTLIVTEACNLRCRYCVYSERYPGLKSYSNKVMSFDTARKAIDSYMAAHVDRQEHGLARRPAILFYGGEPLIESDLISRCIDYCAEQGYDPRYYVTSNGTLMSDEVIDLMVKHEVMLTVSLDGPKSEHDRKRVYGDQRGSFDDVMRNLTRLQERKAAAGVTVMLNFNCCYDTYTDLEAVVSFFEENEALFAPCSVMCSPIQAHNSDYYNWLDEEAAAGRLEGSPNTLSRSLEKLRGRYTADCVAGRPISNILVSLMAGYPLTAHRYQGCQSTLKNACVPGSKVAVDSEGRLYACEKMNQQCPIGHVDTGMDLEAVDRLFQDYLAIWQTHCADCDVSRLCNICPAYLANQDNLVFSETFCQDAGEGYRRLLRSLYSILEKSPSAFQDLARFSVQFDEATWEDR